MEGTAMAAGARVRNPRWVRASALVGGLAAPLLQGAAALAAAAPIEAALARAGSADYAVYAVHVGTSRPVALHLFLAGTAPAERVPIAFFFWAIVGPDAVVLVDTGFADRDRAEKWGLADHRAPLQALAALGLRANDVDDIAITHGHWDHVGGLSDFPRARVWFAPGEFAALSRQEPVDPRLGATLAALEREGRLAPADDAADVVIVRPGLALVRQGRHTPRFQYVVVQSPRGRYILASDEAPLYRNVEGPTPSGQTHDAAASLATLRTMRALVGGGIERIVPGHDPLVLTRYTPVAPGVVRILARAAAAGGSEVPDARVAP